MKFLALCAVQSVQRTANYILSIFCSFFYWRVNVIYDSLSQLDLEVLKESDTTERLN